MTPAEEAAEVTERLMKGSDAANHASMWLSDVVDICDNDPDGQALPPEDAARLLGLAYAARHDTQHALKMAKRTLRELHRQYQVSESEGAVAS